MDDELRRLSDELLSCTEISRRMGVSKNAVFSRAKRTKVKLKSRNKAFVQNGHRAADERSAELLRQAGVRI